MVTASASTINEDGTSNLTLALTNAGALFENSDDSVTVTMSLSNGATLHGAGVSSLGGGVFTLTALSPTDLNGLTITPASEFDGTVHVGVSAVAHDGTATSRPGTTSTMLTVNPVADAGGHRLGEHHQRGRHQQSSPSRSPTLAACSTEDATDSVTVTMSSCPMARHGTARSADLGDGTFTLTVHCDRSDDLAGLTITPAASFEGSIPFNVGGHRA